MLRLEERFITSQNLRSIVLALKTSIPGALKTLDLQSFAPDPLLGPAQDMLGFQGDSQIPCFFYNQ